MAHRPGPSARGPASGGRSTTSSKTRASTDPATVRRAFEELSTEIRRCTLCPLAANRTHAVVYRGSLAPRVVFVGEAPGAEEDRQGLPFVGRSGQVLDRAVALLGPAMGQHGVLNLLKCRPPANRFDRRAAVTCRPYLDRQLALLRPQALVSLGAWALAALDPGAPRILSAAGVPRRSPAGWLFPLVHPAATLRSGRLRARWETDVAALRAWLSGPPFEML